MNILILKEHHGNRYLDVSTPEKLRAVALSIIKKRFGGKNLESMVPSEPEKPDFDIDQVPTSLKEGALLKLADYNRRYAACQNVMNHIAKIKLCLATNDGNLAWQILCLRKHYEDEGFSVVQVDEEY